MQRSGLNLGTNIGDLSDVRAVREPLRRKRRGVPSVRFMFVAIVVLAFAAFVAASHRPVEGPAPEAAAPIAAPASPKWIATAKADAWFTLQAAAVADLPRSYVVNSEAGNAGREDILTFGAPGGEGAYLRLEIRRSERDGVDPSLFVALVRRAADTGLAVTRAGQPFPLPTRLGPFEASEVTLTGGDRHWDCLGFRLHSTDTRLRILALACGAGGKPPEPAAAACLMDWLDLAATAYDPVLRNFFAEADRRRGSACKAPRSIADALKDDPASAAGGVAQGKARHVRKRARAALNDFSASVGKTRS